MKADFQTHSQRAVSTVLTVLAATALVAVCAANLWAAATCAPQAGKWTPWTGKICYGEHDR
jgi:hypothetical protein